MIRDAYQILNDNPSIVREADQWIENGFVFWNGLVHSYETDRKEQTNMLFGSFTVEEFLDRPDITDREREWILEARKRAQPKGP